MRNTRCWPSLLLSSQFLACLLLLAGCGLSPAGEDGPPTEEGILSYEAFILTKAELERERNCDLLFGECPERALLHSRMESLTPFSSAEECKARPDMLDVARRRAVEVPTRMETGAVLYAPDRARECLQELEQRLAEDSCMVPYVGRPEVCEEVVVGALAVDDFCTADYECESEFCYVEPSYDESDRECEATCRPAPALLQIGDRCNMHNYALGRCDPDEDLICDLTAEGGLSECTEKGMRQEGEHCASNEVCELGLACDGVCRRIEVAEFGEACERDYPRTYCRPGLTCLHQEDSSFRDPGICGEFRQLGERCIAYECASGSVCRQRECIAHIPDGGSCDDFWTDNTGYEQRRPCRDRLYCVQDEEAGERICTLYNINHTCPVPAPSASAE